MSQNFRASTSWPMHTEKGSITKVRVLHTKDFFATSTCDKNESALFNSGPSKVDCCCAVPSKCITHCPSTMSNKEQQTSSSRKHRHSSKSPLILVLYTGGTIGMQPNDNDVLAPTGLVFSQKIMEDSYLNDKKLVDELGLRGDSGIFITSAENLVIRYKIKEYSPLLDSSNIGVREWIRIAEDIRDNYDYYNGFIILHGTDTLTYTASALSFMLEGLQKPVVVTGAQISIFMLRSDARSNMIGALVFAATAKIKEVCIYFNHKLIRGNRAVKFSADALEGFISPNYPLLAKAQLKIEESYSPPDFLIANEFHVALELCPYVVLLPVFPTLTGELVEKVLSEPIQGAVLQTFGAGNVPSNNEGLLLALKNAVDRGVIIVNVSQCLQATVSAIYETGQYVEQILGNIGVISGYDMTAEAAYTKLCYVLALPISLEDKIKLMQMNLRGELNTGYEKKSTSMTG